MKRILHCEAKGQRKKGRQKKWKKQVEAESIMVSLSREDTLC